MFQENVKEIWSVYPSSHKAYLLPIQFQMQASYQTLTLILIYKFKKNALL